MIAKYGTDRQTNRGYPAIMNEFKDALTAYLRGHSNFADLDAALDRALAQHPNQLPHLTAMLTKARDYGLEAHVFAALNGRLLLPDSSTDTHDDTYQPTIPMAPPGAFVPAREGAALLTDAEMPTVLDIENEDRTAPEAASGGSQIELKEDRRTRTDENDTTAVLADPTLSDKTVIVGGTTRADGSIEYGPGDRLRNRFELESKLGEGGMGAVWRARDLLRVRAMDRKPYVAVKLLQGDFKEHPEAFIALQRETAKQQRLAHPNIATVYDFDRDAETGTVFMTMEAMEGLGLDDYIRSLPEGGLSPEEAMPLIEQLSAGLDYAHANNLVHSDLKPGNCFLTNEGTVKLLDFGIARASKTQTEGGLESDADGEKTLFDPGELGAITPTYATIEMFDGIDPSPSDDIYALAIMTYQLLTGEHPYARKPAPQAMQMGLIPKSIEKLNKHQNRGLARALAFKRSERTQTVEEFLEALRPKKSRAGLYASAAVLSLFLFGLLAYGPVVDYLQSQQNEAIIANMSDGGLDNLQLGLDEIRDLPNPAQRDTILSDPRVNLAIVKHIQRGDKGSIEQGLNLIAPFPSRWQRDVLGDPRARKAIAAHYSQRVNEAFSPADGRLDYAAALAVVEQLQLVYPNSASVLTIRNNLAKQKNLVLDQLQTDFERRLAEGTMLGTSSTPDIALIPQQIANLEPTHPLVTDLRLPKAFVSFTEQALHDGDLDRASALVRAGLNYLPENAELSRLDRLIAEQLRAKARELQVAQARVSLSAIGKASQDVARYLQVREDMLTLLEFAPDDAILTEHQRRLGEIFPSHFDHTISTGNLDTATSNLISLAPLLDIAYLRRARSLLTEAGARPTTKYPTLAADVTQRIGALLAAPNSGQTWSSELLVLYKQLTALPSAQSNDIDAVGVRIAGEHTVQAREAITTADFERATALLDAARMFDESSVQVDTANGQLMLARDAHQKQLAEQAIQQRIVTLQASFRHAAQQDDLVQAHELIEGLRKLVPSEDPFLVSSMPTLLGASYLRLAKYHVGKEDYESALKLIDQGLAIAPRDTALEEARSLYTVDVQRLAVVIELRQLFRQDQLLPAQTEAKLSRLKDAFPDRVASLRSEFASIRHELLLSAVTRTQPRSANLPARVAEFVQLFPERRNALMVQLEAALEKRIHEVAATDPIGAHVWLESAQSLLPESRKINQLRAQLPPRGLLLAQAAGGNGALTEAQRLVDAELVNMPAHIGLVEFKSTIENHMATTTARFNEFAEAVKTGKLASRNQRAEILATIVRAWSDNPEFTRINYVDRRAGQCAADLQGEGKLDTGVCFDLVAANVKGPVLVVVPGAPEYNLPPFAIGKYEVSVQEYNIYCRLSGACAGLQAKNQKLPATNLSLREAEDYLFWMSAQASTNEKTAVVYRLPSQREWQYAANTKDDVPLKGINCKPDGKVKLNAGVMQSQGGTLSLGVPIGRSLVSATFGEANAWGIVNAAGNAQEWVRASAGVLAQGGAFSDQASACNSSFERPHNGLADPLTGFRIMRELQ